MELDDGREGVEARRGAEQERVLASAHQAVRLIHVYRHALDPVVVAAASGGPVEALHERRQHGRHGLQREAHAGASAAAAAEGHEVEVLPAGLQALGGAARHEPLRAERQGLLPECRVAADGPDVDEHGGLRRHGEPSELHLLRRLAVRDGRRRVQPQRLLVWQPRQVRLAGDPVPADDGVDLRHHVAQGLRVVHQFRQHPLHHGRRRVRTSSDHVDDEGLDVVPCELDLRRLVLGFVHEDVKQVLVHRRRRGLLLPAVVAVVVEHEEFPRLPGVLLVPEYLLEQRVEAAVDGGGSPAEALQVPAAAEGDVVVGVEGADELRHVLDELLRLVRDAPRHGAGDHADDGGVGEADELAGEVEGFGRRRGGRRQRGPQQGHGAGATDGAEVLDGAGSEELRHAEALHEAPVGVVGGEGEAGGAVGELPGHRRERPLRDAPLVAADQLARHLRGARHDAVRGPQADVHQGPHPGSQLLEGAVHRRPEQVEVPDHWEASRARGKTTGGSPGDEVLQGHGGDGRNNERQDYGAHWMLFHAHHQHDLSVLCAFSCSPRNSTARDLMEVPYYRTTERELWTCSARNYCCILLY
ncbi:hypothetical protein SETIT_7G002800v2 [Setaria italica]|uniref:Uncharacterized protein n=1 Tax=Setaria italica TaxID=4555 RepID=A0A368RQD7_SETIT|nr:hypothetical protein SETIT_7G002800v2 [Setaria italica]